MASCIVFWAVVPENLLHWVLPNIHHAVFYLVVDLKLMNFYQPRPLLLRSPMAMPAAITLSQYMHVVGWRCPSSVRVSWNISILLRSRIVRLTLPLLPTPPQNLGWWYGHKDAISLDCFVVLIIQLRKKCPHARLLSPGMEKYDTSECTFKIMSDV